MEVTIRTCDICKGAISSYDPDKKLLYQNGPQYQNLHGILIDEYKIHHACILCVINISEVIDIQIKTMWGKVT